MNTRLSPNSGEGGYFMPKEAQNLMTALALTLRSRLGTVKPAQEATSARKRTGAVVGHGLASPAGRDKGHETAWTTGRG